MRKFLLAVKNNGKIFVQKFEGTWDEALKTLNAAKRYGAPVGEGILEVEKWPLVVSPGSFLKTAGVQYAAAKKIAKIRREAAESFDREFLGSASAERAERLRIWRERHPAKNPISRRAEKRIEAMAREHELDAKGHYSRDLRNYDRGTAAGLREGAEIARRNPAARFEQVEFSSLGKELEKDVKTQLGGIYHQGIFRFYGFIPNETKTAIAWGQWCGLGEYHFPYYADRKLGTLYRELEEPRGNPVEYTSHYKRERITRPENFDPRSFRTKTLNEKKKLIIACPTGKYKGGKCSVGMKAQSLLTRRNPLAPERKTLIGRKVKALEYYDAPKARAEGLENPGTPWRHDFKGGGGKVYGLANGDVLIKGKKKLWGYR
jgi:hypothetical protein